MKGDFSRISFDPTKHYAGVLHQQGRVWLDSDWNEDVFERLNQLQQETYDIVGSCGVPTPGTAFQISPGPDPARPENFAIGGGAGAAGRAYVQGLLCHMDAPTTYFTQPDLLDALPIQFPQDGSDHFGLIYLEVWRRLITYLEDPSVAEIALGGPDTATRIKILSQVKALLVPAGTTCSDLSSYLPATDATLTTLQPAAKQPSDLCSLPDPANYTGQENHLYRVEIHTGGGTLDSTGTSLSFSILLSQDAAAGATSLSLASVLTSQQIASIGRWGNVLTLNDAQGRAEQINIATVTVSGNVLVLATPLANSFTVANKAAVLGLAQFKWSTDNGIYAVSILSVGSDRQKLTLASLGRDQATALKQGDIVEVVDDASELGPARGHLTTITGDPDPDLLTVTIADPLPAAFRLSTDPNPPPTDRHLVVRRWDGRGVARTAYDDSATPDMNLGNGVHIQFGGSDLRPGDYWNIVARSADGSVQSLFNAPPRGIVRYYCPLAVVKWSPLPVGSPPASPPVLAYAMQLVQDCRNIFSPLTQVPGTDDGMRIAGLFALNAATGGRAALLNDQTVALSTILGGIDVVCDQNVDPNSVSRPDVYFTLEIPFTSVGQAVATPVVAYQTLSIVGTVTARGRVISWRFDPNAAKVMPQIAALRSQADRGVLCRFTLKGNYIWSLGNPRLYLDGESFGLPASTGGTSISLPSGNQRRGGDFETWFWLTPDPKNKEKEKEIKGTDKISDNKLQEIVKVTDKAKETEKVADIPKISEKAIEKSVEKSVEKSKDRDKTRDKTKEKVSEKIKEKTRDKIKDRELAPVLNSTSTKFSDIALQLPNDETADLGRPFIRADERPDVGRKLLDDIGGGTKS